MKAKELGINLYSLMRLNLGGKGGKESLIQEVFSSSWERVSAKLYDFRNHALQKDIELKKQVDLQWFDPGKYHNLSREQREILLTFNVVNKDSKEVDLLFTVSTGDFIDSVFSEQEIKDSFEYEKKYKGTQIKKGTKIREWFRNNRDKTNLLYVRDADINNVLKIKSVHINQRRDTKKGKR